MLQLYKHSAMLQLYKHGALLKLYKHNTLLQLHTVLCTASNCSKCCSLHIYAYHMEMANELLKGGFDNDCFTLKSLKMHTHPHTTLIPIINKHHHF